jgi:hypothetical protein
MTAVFSAGFFRLNSFPKNAAAAIDAGISSGNNEGG